MDAETINQALAPLPLGPVRYFNQIGSTNTEAAQWAEAGAPDLSLVVADEQTAGRGRFKRRWYTPAGAGLAFSLVLRRRPEDEGQKRAETGSGFSRLTALGALAVCAALKSKWAFPAQIKWPNDVLVNGRKLAGILVETHWQGDQLSAAILGIGINVSPASIPPREALKYPATSVVDCLLQAGIPGPAPDRPVLLFEVLRNLVEWRLRLDSEAFLQAWEEALAFRGEWVNVDLDVQEVAKGSTSSSTREGRVLGLAQNGALRLVDRLGAEFTVQTGELTQWPGFTG